ncbi:hypothetical protein Pint_33593 [Pistacia integerrima]|uniref:Uncharacterized protein n=1 Tax=Pistacia integerrima TaxID=434235 RepID=A0ACC0X504_9ROSI|nr:hypothetical protein Pint_33593 [Pistacia integerrima]
MLELYFETERRSFTMDAILPLSAAAMALPPLLICDRSHAMQVYNRQRKHSRGSQAGLAKQYRTDGNMTEDSQHKTYGNIGEEHDLGVISTVAARYGPSLLKSFALMGPQGALDATKLFRPFSEIVDSLDLKDPFIQNWVDLLVFLPAGAKSNGILSAEVVSIMN